MSKVLYPLLAIFLSGCAGVTHKPVPYTGVPVDPVKAVPVMAANATADEKASGIRYYQASPYLLVYADGKGGIVWKIYYLPDQSKKMTADSFNFVSKVTANLTFNHGVLTDSIAEVDSTAIPKAISAAVEKLAPFVAAADLPPSQKIPPPRLYKIVVDGDNLLLKGGPGDAEISVTIKAEK